MKTFKTLGSFVLFASSLMLVTSCSKNMDEQASKGDLEVESKAHLSCANFLGIQTKQNNPGGTYVFLGTFQNPIALQNFYESDFSANTLIQFSATGGTPYYDPQYIRIGVNDQWINTGETITLKLTNNYAKRMHMQYRTMDGVGMAEFFLEGEAVGSTPIVGSGINGFLVYSATGANKEFDEVKFSVTSGKLALSGFTPNLVGGGPSGFFLVNEPGDRLVLRLKTGVTNIGGTDYPNQYFQWTTNFVEGPEGDRQNRRPLPSLALGSGEFDDNTNTPVIPGSKTFVNITGTTAGVGTPLVYRAEPHFRIGVGDQYLQTDDEEITITPGADFPTTMFRAVEVRVAALNGAQLRVTAYNGTEIVGSEFSSGADKEWILVTSHTDFDRVVIRRQIGFGGGNEPSVGRVTPGPVGGAILLYPGCN